MLDINYIREHQEEVKQAAANKQLDPQVVEQFLVLDQERRRHLQETEHLRAQSNQNAATIKKSLMEHGGKPDADLVAKGKTLKEELKVAEEKLKVFDQQFKEMSLQIPNVPAEDVPLGKDESGNQVVRQVGEIKKLPFTPKSHEDLMLNLDLLDIKRAVQIGGFRTYMLKKQAVVLEQALLNYALKMMIDEGFTALTAPVLVNREAMVGTGYFPWGQEDHYYTQDQQILAGTAEVALTSFYAGETLNERDLPIKMIGISPCFRREVGTYGKDTKGIIRVHQFNKVEQVVYTIANEKVTREWHQKMVGFAEKLLQDLGLPYQVLLMCTGDMGAGQRKKYDIETWFPAQGRYRETHSASYFNDFQARRLNIKYRASDGTVKYVYTLNNTVAASPRLLAAVVENYQREDGSVVVPEVLRPFTGFEEIKAVKLT
ncbi:MAG: serine--tRNA ligase [bacterium]|nr:serine--tRNA ligase [bacterium]